MPRKPLEFSVKVEYLSILDENGVVDTKLEPKLSKDELKTMYRYMLLARRADERLLKLQRQGRIGTFPQATGHEAISLGSAFVLQKEDWYIPAYRELAGWLYRGWPFSTFLLYWMGFEEGAQPPEGVNDTPICVPVASQLLHAAGVGMAMNLKDDKKAVITYFGDGAASEGDAHEALNFASVFNAPVVFICLNNQYAISVPITKQMRCETVAQRAVAYGIPGIRVDGDDVLAVYAATKEAVDRAKAGGGPTLIEGLTYRWTAHTTADDPKRYRSSEDAEKWAKREPLIRFKKYLLTKGVMKEADFEKMEEEIEGYIKSEIAKAEELAQSAKIADPFSSFDYLYAELPDHLRKQKEELAKHLGISLSDESQEKQASKAGRK